MIKSKLIWTTIALSLVFGADVDSATNTDASQVNDKADEQKDKVPAANEKIDTAPEVKEKRAMSPKEAAARKRIERKKAEAKARKEKELADPNYAKKREIFKQQALVNYLMRKLTEAQRKLQADKISMLGGRLKKKPETQVKDTKKSENKTPANAPGKDTSKEAPIVKTVAKDSNLTLKMLADEAETSEGQGLDIDPLTLVEEAKAELDQARANLEEGLDAEVSDDQLDALIEEESKASALYLDTLKFAKEFYTEVQAAIKDNPPAEGSPDVAELPDLIQSLDADIANEQAIMGNEEAMTP